MLNPRQQHANTPDQQGAEHQDHAAQHTACVQPRFGRQHGQPAGEEHTEHPKRDDGSFTAGTQPDPVHSESADRLTGHHRHRIDGDPDTCNKSGLRQNESSTDQAGRMEVPWDAPLPSIHEQLDESCTATGNDEGGDGHDQGRSPEAEQPCQQWILELMAQFTVDPGL